MLFSSRKKSLAKASRTKSQRIFIYLTVSAFLLGTFLASPFLLQNQTAMAAGPMLGHWSINKMAGSASASTTAYAMTLAADDTAAPGGSPDLTVTAFYKNTGWSDWAESACVAQETNSNLFKCALNIASSTDTRTFKYYLRAHDGTEYFFQSWSSVTNSTTSAQASPMETTVYNSPAWANTISGQYSSTNKWAGVKDGRCTSLTVPVTTATTTIQVLASSASTNGLGMTPSQWISLENEKFQITATTTVGSNLVIVLSTSTATAHSASACVFQYLAGATIWVQGTTINATSSNAATTDYGTFILQNVPDGNYDVVGYKKNYMDGKLMGVSVGGGATTTVQLMLPYGTFGGGGGVEGTRVVWTAPQDGMMGAPSDISISKMPILIALSENASSTTITTSTVQLRKVNADQTTTLVEGYSVAYEPLNSTVTINSTSYDFGNEAKIIVYSPTQLATSTRYIIKMTSDVKNSNGQTLSGNDPQGGHSIMFNTCGGFFSGGIPQGQFGTGGAMMPPFIMGMTPRQGEMNVSLNTKIALLFDQTLDSSTFASNVELWRLDASFNKAAQISINASSTVTNQKMIIITPLTNLTASTRYRVIVKGGIKSSSGVTMAPPDMTSNEMFQYEFTAGTVTDTSGAPTVLALSLDRYKNSAGAYVAVPIAEPIKIAFSEAIDPTTVTASTITLKVKGSSTNLTGTVEYDMNEGKAIFMVGSALNSTSTYVLTLTSGIKDLTKAANAFSATTTEFTTGGTDIGVPRLEFMNADDYNMALTFSEPMNAASITNTTQWPSGSSKWDTSVLNPKNYRLYVDNGPSGTTAKYFSYDSLASSTDLTFNYDSLNNTVKISGLKLLADPSNVRGGARVWVDNVTDVSGNVISESGTKTPPNEFGQNSKGGPVQNSSQTFGMIGPSSGMMAPPSSANTFTNTDFGGKDPAMMGMMPVGVWPMNKLAGAYSIYMIDLPASTTIPAGGKIVVGPFPSESDVSLAKNADKTGLFAHYDINGPGPGKVVLDTTTVETSGGTSTDGVTVSGQIVTVNLGSVGTGAPDFIHIELDGIKNPSTPTQGGYKIAIQTQTSDNRQLESFNSMPFFIMPKGKYTLIGKVRSGGTSLNGVNLYGGSPATGPLQTATANNAFGSSTDGEFKIEGLSSGQTMISPEPYILVGSTEYVSSQPQPIFLDDTTTANTTGEAVAGVTTCTASTCYYYKDFNLTTVSAANTPALTVKIYGNFSSGGVGTTNLDIFAGGPSGFRVKTVSLSTDCSVTPSTQTLNLPAIGNFNIGIGPAMPKGPMGMAGPMMPTSWMPPKNENVTVAGSGGTWTWIENSATPNDGTMQFVIQVADKTIRGRVLDPAGNPVSNAQIFAYSPTEMFGTNAQSTSTGGFVLNVKQGSYKVGAFLPGAPPSGEIAVDVKSDNSVYADNVLTTLLTLKLTKNIQTGYTISGYVYSDTSSNYPASNASVYAYNTGGAGHSETMTDSKGSYTLYVGNGTWKVGVSLPDYGNLTEQTVTIASASKSGLNFTPSGSIVIIRERVWQDADNNGSYDPGEGISNATVSVISSSTDYVNSVITDSNGLYEAKVPASTVYDIQAWSSDIGSLPPVKNISVTTTDIIYSSFSGLADVATEHATTVEFTFYDASGNATTVDKVLIQLDQLGAEGVSNDVYKEDAATTTIRVATSTTPYLLDLEVQGIPKELLTISPFISTTTAVGTSTVGTKLFATTTVNGYERIKIILPALSYISGYVYDATATIVPNAVLHIEQPGNDVEFDVEANSAGYYSFRVASSSSPYLIQADKTGYVDSAVSVYTTSSAVSFNPEVDATAYSISGTITVNSSAPGTNCYVFAEKLGGGYVSTSGNCDSTTGAYTVKVINGDWEVSAVVEGYNDSTKTSTVNIASANQTGVNIDITASQTLSKDQAQGMTGTSGGTFTHSDANFSMNVPQSTISASDSSTYNVKEKEISNIPAYTPTCNLVGDKADEVSAYKNSGSNSSASTVSSLNGAAFVDKIYTIAELAAEGIDTITEVEQTKMGTYDDTAQNWTNIPTTITYLNSSNQPVVPASNLSNVAEVVFNGVTKHFSTFGVTNTVYDGLAPATPTNVAVAQSGTSNVISWTAVTTNIDSTTATDITKYNIWRSLSSASSATWTKIGAVSTSTTSYTDNNTVSGTTYYYRVTADSGLQSAFSLAVTGTGSTTPPPSGGGGGGGSSQTVLTQTTTTPAATTTGTTATTTISAVSTTTASTISTPQTTGTTGTTGATSQVGQTYVGVPSEFKFKLSLKYKTTNSDIKNLQIILNSDPDTRIAQSGVGSPGYETNFFGDLTKKAVIKFQEKYKADILTPLGLTEGTGLVGSATIAKLNQLLGQVLSSVQTPVTSTPSTGTGSGQAYTGVPANFKFKLTLKYKMASSDIKNLQIMLNADPATRIAQAGVGSPGHETNIFGDLTKAAVIKFQEKYKAEILTPLGLTEGTGLVGSATIAKLNQLLGQ